MKKHLVLLLSLLLFQLVHSQENPFQAKLLVRDAAPSAVALEGATIKNLKTGAVNFTNEKGEVYLGRVMGLDSIQISAIGYETKRQTWEEVLNAKGIVPLKQQPVLLQEMTIVTNAGNYNQAISKVDVKMRGIGNAQEALRIVPGLFIGQHAGGGKAEQIFLRGFDVDHGTDVNISVDGMPVNMVSHAHGQGYADLHFVIPEAIKTVQFKKGPYDAAKGNFTTAGFVDFKTKNVLEKSMVKLEGGQFNTLRGLALLNILKPENQKKASLYLATEYMKTRGFFDHPQDFNRFNLFSKYTTRVGANSRLSISASAFKSKWNASGQIPQRAVDQKLISFFGAIDPDEGGETSRRNINAQLITTIKDKHLLKQQVYYTSYDFVLFSDFTFFLNDAVNGDQIKQKEKRNLLGYNASYSHTQYIGGKKLVTEIGGGFRFDHTNNSELSHTKNRTTILNSLQLGNISEWNNAIYINETLQLTNRFTLNPGVRLDQFNTAYKNQLNAGKINRNNATILSPKLNLSYRFSDHIELYAATGKGFHSNDTRVISQNIKNEILPAAYGTDFGINLKPIKNIFINAALWCLFLQQEFVYVGDEGIIEPSGKTKRSGLDFSLRYQPLKKLFIDADINYAKARFIDAAKGENFVPLAPKLTASGGISYKATKGLNGSLRYRYMGDRPANEQNTVIAKGYFVTDAVVAYTKKSFDISLSVQNLFDVRWKETQFETESQLKNESMPVSEIHFTPGTPFFLKLGLSVFF